MFIGAEQAGIGVSYFLKCAGIRHIVLERSRIRESWRSLQVHWRRAGRLYEPSSVRGRVGDICEDQGLPGVAHTPAISLSRPASSGPYVVRTPERMFVARNVVMASGSQNCPKSARARPIAAWGRYADCLPEQLGSGSSGGQIAEDLIEAGPTVFLPTNRVPSFPRRYCGRFLRTVTHRGTSKLGRGLCRGEPRAYRSW
jgi:putative flavoprotein involved in K+ transport